MGRFLIFLGVFTSVISKPLDVEITAKSAILINAETGAILYEKQPHLPLYPGSIIKIATALFALDAKKVDVDRMVMVSEEALKIKPKDPSDDYPPHWGAIEGTKAGLLRGEVLSINSLLHGLMLVSGNDAANVIAESLSTSIPQYVFEMNEYLKNLGCLNTHFKNPHGLHHSEQHTTAYDMSLIMQKALKIDKFREVSSRVSYNHPATNKRNAFELFNTNRLIKKGQYRYQKLICAKNGYHSRSLHTIVASAEHEGRVLIGVVLGCQDRFDKYKEVVRLFEAAFSEVKQTRECFKKGTPFERLVEGAKAPLVAQLKESLQISFYPAEEPEIRASITWKIPALPIHQGAVVGEVLIQDSKGNLLKQEALIASKDVEESFFYRLRSYFNRFLRALHLI